MMNNAAGVANPSDNATAGIAFYFFLTSVLIWVTLTLKPVWGRWPCLVVGAFFVFVKGYWLIVFSSGNPPKGLFFTEIWGLAAAVLILWYGWKYPKDDTVKKA